MPGQTRSRRRHRCQVHCELFGEFKENIYNLFGLEEFIGPISSVYSNVECTFTDSNVLSRAPANAPTIKSTQFRVPHSRCPSAASFVPTCANHLFFSPFPFKFTRNSESIDSEGGHRKRITSHFDCFPFLFSERIIMQVHAMNENEIIS